MIPDLVPIILVDTREQRPLPIEGYTIERVTLPVADYSIKGFGGWDNPQFIVERKSLSDLIGSLTHDRARFEREVLKMRQFGFRALLIECERGEVELGQYRSSVKPQAVLQSLAAFQVRHNLHVVWTGTPTGAARTLERLVRQFVRGIEGQYKELTTAAQEPAAETAEV